MRPSETFRADRTECGKSKEVVCCDECTLCDVPRNGRTNAAAALLPVKVSQQSAHGDHDADPDPLSCPDSVMDDTKPLRVLSLLSAATEIVYRLGCDHLLVGRSHGCDDPPLATTLPVATAPRIDPNAPSAQIDEAVRAQSVAGGPVYHIHADLVKRLRPDVVITQEQCRICAVTPEDVTAACALSPGLIKLVTIKPITLDDVLGDVTTIAAALGVPERGERLVGLLRSRLASLSVLTVRPLAHSSCMHMHMHMHMYMCICALVSHRRNPAAPQPLTRTAGRPDTHTSTHRRLAGLPLLRRAARRTRRVDGAAHGLRLLDRRVRRGGGAGVERGEGRASEPSPSARNPPPTALRPSPSARCMEAAGCAMVHGTKGGHSQVLASTSLLADADLILLAPCADRTRPERDPTLTHALRASGPQPP